MKSDLGKFSIDSISNSAEVAEWLAQFPINKQLAAKSLLYRLRFVSRDAYSQWIIESLMGLPSNGSYALYAVRKIEDKNLPFWDNDGNVLERPGASLGSEDLVYSVISNSCRMQHKFLDHPSITDLHKNKVATLVLVEDSIGSGQRIVDFINLILKNRSVMSWWSFGWIRFIVLSYARTREGESYILKNISGSDHPFRRNRKSEKICFISELVYDAGNMASRWGKDYNLIIDLVDNQKQVNYYYQRGFGGIMSNIVFYHSVPDNIPGVVWCNDDQWKGLFIDRALPIWAVKLIEGNNNPDVDCTMPITFNNLPSDIIELLRVIKLGIRQSSAIAMRLSCETSFAVALLKKAKAAGLITDTNRITKAGNDVLRTKQQVVAKYDYSLYTPQSWSTGQ